MENEPRGHDLPADTEPDERTIAEARLELESLRQAYDELMGQLRVEGEEQQRRLQVARDAERERIATQIEEANAKAANDANARAKTAAATPRSDDVVVGQAVRICAWPSSLVSVRI